jgi:rhomboid protease GluP
MSNRIATTVLAAVFVVVFVYEVGTGVAGSEAALLPLGALRTRGWSAADWWRIITFSFLHLNALHLALNLVGLYWLGGIVEQRVGATGVLVVFAVSGLMSGIAGMVLGAVLPTTGIAVGASGAVFGLLAAAVVVVFRSNAEQDRRLRMALATALIVAVGISVLPGVSLAGHAGGLVGGASVALVARRRCRRTSR